MGTGRFKKNGDPISHSAIEKLKAYRKNRWVGSRIHGGGLIADYMDTYFGLIPSSKWALPEHVYEAFLMPPTAMK